LLAEAARMDTLITSHWGVMGEFDRRRRVKIFVDEWGTWHRGGSEIAPSHLFGQQSTMRDALVAALTLDIFHRHVDKVSMANIAQLVNCLQSLFLADGDRFITTPTFHVFELYAAHVGGRAVRSVVTAPSIAYERVKDKGSLFGLAGSASIKERTLTLTVVNPHLTQPREVEIAVRGGTANGGAANAMILAADDVHAHNTFERPKTIEPRADRAGAMQSGVLTHRFPPASITRLTIPLG
jgi:alpha-L-arabinofuranosidase